MKKVPVSRNSINGRFVTSTYADKHPRTTEHEHVYKPAPKTSKNK